MSSYCYIPNSCPKGLDAVDAMVFLYSDLFPVESSHRELVYGCPTQFYVISCPSFYKPCIEVLLSFSEYAGFYFSLTGDGKRITLKVW